MANIHKNLFNLKEITILQKYFDTKPYTNVQTVNGVLWCKNKNLDYHVPNTFVHSLVKPKIKALLGDHEMSMGSYKECVWPYGTHTDADARYDFDGIHRVKTTVEHNRSMVIPLCEGPYFNTIVFNCSDTNGNVFHGTSLPFRSEWLNSSNTLDLDTVDHIPLDVRSTMSKLPLDQLMPWALGDVLSWDRNQLHCSTNFAKYGLVKKFIVIFIA